ncbi:hypothetical protein RV134_250089 [Roseovarius sp. EC-HK134]|nr:hypothetical protein RV420_280069 [Roseovarius sp. EC-SD190]VVT05548.1 hypothetical protein RV134_250089 [Roseovarius sp. EC-HK134]
MCVGTILKLESSGGIVVNRKRPCSPGNDVSLKRVKRRHTEVDFIRQSGTQRHLARLSC